MDIVGQWTGREARALRLALRLSVRAFAAYLGVAVRTVSKWEKAGSRTTPWPDTQAMLDTCLAQAADAVKARFAALLAEPTPTSVEDYIPSTDAAEASTEPAGLSPLNEDELPVPAPGNGYINATIEAVRLALMGASHGLPGGQVLPLELLRARVNATIDALCRCEREPDTGAALPGLIRDLHTTLAAGRDVAELLSLTAWLHSQATVSWLSIVDAPVDLRSHALTLARHAAGNRGTVVSAGLVAAASARVGLAAGAFDLATAALDAVTVPTNTVETMQLSGFLALRRSVVAAADGRPCELNGAVEYATDLAERTGEGNAYGLGFGPIKVGLYRMAGLLEIGDYEQVAALAESLNPQAHVNRSGQAAYWADYGRALARMRGRQRDAVRALRRAELISPHRIQRGPVVREVLAELIEDPKGMRSAGSCGGWPTVLACRCRPSG